MEKPARLNRLRLTGGLNVWSRIPLRYRGTLVALIPVVGLIATLGTWAWTRAQARTALDWIDHTQMVMAESDHLLITALNAETGVRGFVITGDEDFLDPYNQAVKAFPEKVQQLSQLIADNPEQHQRLTAVSGIMQRQLDLLQRRIDLRRQSAQPPLGGDDLPYQGKALMDEVRMRLATFQTVEQHILTARQEKLEDLRDLITTTVWGIGGLSVLSSLIAIAMFNKIDWEIEEQDLQLRRGRSLTRGIVANVVDGVITLDQQGNIETLNPAAVEMFGYAQQTMVGKPLELLLAAPPAHATQNQILRVGFNLSAMKRQPMVGCRSDGTLFPMDISISEIEAGSQWITIIRDITDLKLSEVTLKARATELSRVNLMLAKTNADLQERNRELDQFAYVASHDLKAPLRAIGNLSEWLEEDLKGTLPAENQHQMQLLRGRVHRMEALINGLLQYSRIGRTELPIETVNVADLLAEVIESLDPPDEFTLDIAPNLPILETKRLLLSQVFSNLIGNAIRHHPGQNGTVQVGVTDAGDRYQFSIRDNGTGIAPEFQDRIFTIFQTLEPRDTVENTGIGLAIVKKIVESEGGTIAVESAIDQGATFTFTWLKHSFGRSR